MRYEDTVALNRDAFATLLGKRKLTQAALAVQLGVSRLTVGRWNTGQVRRISLHNLRRLAQELDCRPEDLQGEECAARLPSQEERSSAARLIVSAETLELFTRSGEMEKYEQLLRAMTHPEVGNQELLDLYMMLTFVAAKRGQVDTIQQYARLKRDYAVRCGDLEVELEARMNLATCRAVRGELAAALRELDQLQSLAESLGAREVLPVALINKILLYRLLGRAAASLRAALQVLELLRDMPLHSLDRGMAWLNLALLLAECGARPEAAACLKRARRLLAERTTPEEQSAVELFALALRSLGGSPIDRADLLSRLPACLAGEQSNADQSVWALLLLRRLGELEAAECFLLALEERLDPRSYTTALVKVEAARLAAARGRDEDARLRRQSANSCLLQFGMAGRCGADPGQEADQVLSLSPSALRRLEVLLQTHQE